MSTQKGSGRGRGWRGNKQGHATAGRLGGMTTAETHDSTFYAQIGRLGGLKRGKKLKKDITPLAETETIF